MASKKKILIIIPSLGVGGAENVLLNFLNLMDYDRYEVDLYVVLNSGVYFDRIPSKVNLHILHYNRYIEKLSRIFYSKFFSLFIHKIYGKKIKGDYDFGLCFLDAEATEYIIHNGATIRRKATLIQSSYKTWDLIASRVKGKYIGQMKKRYQALDTIISVSHDAREEFENIFGTHPDHQVIYSPMGMQKVITKSQEKPEIDFDKSVINFIAVGRLIPVKGYDILLKAAQRLKSQALPFHIYIVGKGPLEQELRESAAKLGLQELVTVTGYVENVYPLVKQADVYVMPSRSEGLPTALCEAMILGKPAVATNVSGCKETIEHGKYGLMAEPEPESLSDAMGKMIGDEALRKKYAALSKERGKIFEDKSVMQKYYDLFDGPDLKETAF